MTQWPFIFLKQLWEVHKFHIFTLLLRKMYKLAQTLHFKLNFLLQPQHRGFDLNLLNIAFANWGDWQWKMLPSPCSLDNMNLHYHQFQFTFSYSQCKDLVLPPCQRCNGSLAPLECQKTVFITFWGLSFYW